MSLNVSTAEIRNAMELYFITKPLSLTRDF